MDNFKAVYKILSVLEKAMDYPELDISQIDHNALGVSKERWARYIEMMNDVGYIKNVEISQYLDGSVNVDCTDIKITLKGLEYLQENAVMQRIYKTVKGVKDLVH